MRSYIRDLRHRPSSWGSPCSPKHSRKFARPTILRASRRCLPIRMPRNSNCTSMPLSHSIFSPRANLAAPAPSRAFCKNSAKESSRSKFTFATWIAPPKSCARGLRWRRCIPPRAPARTARASISSSSPGPTRKKSSSNWWKPRARAGLFFRAIVIRQINPANSFTRWSHVTPHSFVRDTMRERSNLAAIPCLFHTRSHSMPFVNEIEEAQADGRLRELYAKIEEKLGFLPHYFKTLGAKPAAIEAQLQMSDAVMADGALSMIVKEQIGLVVSGLNASTYCVMFHMELLRRFGVEKALARKLTADYENAAVDSKVKALFRFADKLTRHPDDIEESDTDAVKQAGWDDAAVRETVLTVAYFNYINRVSLGLGLVTDF